MKFIYIFLVILLAECQRYTQSCSKFAKEPGYIWNEQQCVRCNDPKCICTEKGGCDECTLNYYKNNLDECSLCPIGCASCCPLNKLTDLVCTLCEDGYLLISGVCFQENGCVKISSHGYCMECDERFFRMSSGKCQKCPRGCKTCYSDSFCSDCLDGYYYHLKQVSSEQELAGFVCFSCGIVGCKECSYDEESHLTTCLGCKEGYYFNEVEQCNECEAYCLECFDPFVKPPKCIRCEPNILLNEDQQCRSCQDDIPHCLTCSFAQKSIKSQYYVCDMCDNGFFINEDKTKCLNCRTSDPEHINTRRCESLDEITECQPGYLLVNGQCIKNVNNCIKGDEDGNCTECNSFEIRYTDDEVTKCISCQKSIENCLSCSDTQIECKLCKDTFFLSDGGLCVSCPPQCHSCDQHSCLECEDHYHQDSSGHCLPCQDPNCRKCDPLDVCIECNPGWGISDENTCWSCQRGCLNCSGERQKCTQCADKYSLNDDVCLPYPFQCLRANIEGYCILCQTDLNRPLLDYFQNMGWYDPQYEEFVDETEEQSDENQEETEEIEIEEDENTEEDNNQPEVVRESIFYKSYYGYCLVCSDYKSGTFTCPTQCIENESQVPINSQFLNCIFLCFIIILFL